jgi:hypothetical protein
MLVLLAMEAADVLCADPLAGIFRRSVNFIHTIFCSLFSG